MFEFYKGCASLNEAINQALINAVSNDSVNPRRYKAHQMPQCSSILADPYVRRGIEMTLGRGALWDGVVHVHESGRSDGGWHTDNYWNPATGRDENFPLGRWGLLCYYPEPVTAALGPTEIKTGDGRIRVTGPAGTFFVMRSNLEHRETRNRTRSLQRCPMIKLAVGAQP